MTMAKKKAAKKTMSFEEAITKALHTPHITHKQILELRRQGKLKKKS